MLTEAVWMIDIAVLGCAEPYHEGVTAEEDELGEMRRGREENETRERGGNDGKGGKGGDGGRGTGMMWGGGEREKR